MLKNTTYTTDGNKNKIPTKTEYFKVNGRAYYWKDVEKMGEWEIRDLFNEVESAQKSIEIQLQTKEPEIKELQFLLDRGESVWDQLQSMIEWRGRAKNLYVIFDYVLNRLGLIVSRREEERLLPEMEHALRFREAAKAILDEPLFEDLEERARSFGK